MGMSEEQVVEGGVVREAVVQEGIPQAGEIPRDQVESAQEVKAEESAGKQEEKTEKFICRMKEYKELFDAVFRMAAAVDKDETVLGVDGKGIVIRKFSPSKTELIIVEAPFSAFSEWNAEGEGVFELPLGDVLRILRGAQKGTMAMEIHREKVVIETATERFEIPIFEGNSNNINVREFMEMREPPIPFTVKFTVKTEDMRRALRTIAQSKYGYEIIVKVRNGRVFLTTDTEGMKSEIRLPAFVVDEKEEAEAIYNAGSLYRFFNAVKIPSVTVEMATDKPIRVSGRDGYTFRYYLAQITRR